MSSSDLDRLDDASLALLDPAAMLSAVGTASDQIRSFVERRADVRGAFAGLSSQRPAHVVVAGMGGSGVSGDAAGALADDPVVPVVTVRDYRLPAWVGADDLVVAVSCSGATEETLEVHRAAVERGSRTAVVAAHGSPLARAGADVGSAVVGIDPAGRPPRTNLWTLTLPVLSALEHVGLVALDDQGLLAAASAIDAVQQLDGPAVPTVENRAKRLGSACASGLALVWGTTPTTIACAGRFMAQLAENADRPCAWGALPEVNHNQVVILDAPDAATALHLVLLRDRGREHPQVAKRAEVSAELAAERGIAVHDPAEGLPGADALTRFSALVHRLDLASVYAAYLAGVDPSAIGPITALKERISR
jgi:glucose/mannose-6-phosphate isomerase